MKSAHVALLSISSCAILCLVAVLKRRQSRASRRRRVESNAFYRASQAAFASHAAAASQPGPPPIADTSADNAVVQASPSLPLLLLDERELPLASIATGVALAQADGRLNRAAVGFSRSPCHECRLPASLHYARRKRWNYWAITSDTHLFSVTIADLDYAGLVFAYLYDRTTRQLSEVELIAPLAAGIRLGNRVESPARSAKSRWLAADFVNQLASRRDRIGDRASVTQLHTRCSSFPWMSVDDARTDAGTNTAQTQQQQQQQQGATTARPRVKHALSSKLTVSYPAHHETLNVVIPWNDVEFHFTAKHTLLPVDGTVELTDASGRVQSVRFSAANNSYATLDFGRGRFPYDSTWNWGSFSSSVDPQCVSYFGPNEAEGRAFIAKRVAADPRHRLPLAINIGALWTFGTGMCENAVCIGGKLFKISEELRWQYNRDDWMQPWRMDTVLHPPVDASTDQPIAHADQRIGLSLTFTPEFDRSATSDLLVVQSDVHQMLGTYSGTIVVPALGLCIRIRDQFGWAEEHQARW